MCTAINFNGFFGRTLDYECGFGEAPAVIPRGHRFEFRHRDSIESMAMVGMARLEKGYPLFFDAVNEKGVAMAGLNFVGNAHFPEGKKGGIAAFEFIPYVLSQAESIDSAKKLVESITVVNTPFSDGFSTAPLHWMIGDKDGSITVESTKEGLQVYRNDVGVLTNNPPFPYQMMYLNNFINLTSHPAVDRFSHSLPLTAISRGMGTIGLPGDWSSQSRFVRASFVKENALREKDVAHFFNVMSSVTVPKGCMVLESGETEYTRYVSCMDTEKGIYYYKTYSDTDIKSVALNK